MSINSYAQNFEDVMLWRALAHVERGVYIDVGAQDPMIDSVSLAFHERGWRGIHVEPTPHYAELLRRQRTGDTVIQAAVCNTAGVLRFFEIPGTGISTGNADIASQHCARGFDVHEIAVPCITLASIFEASTWPEIHWLKIDVEGLEQDVLASWGASTTRPWIVVVESTLPMTQTETHEIWEGALVSYGYNPVYFDGLNRYYVSNAHRELEKAFRSPPNVFDGFTLNGTASASFHKLIEQRSEAQVREALAQVGKERESASKEIEKLNLSIALLRQTHAEKEKDWATREQELAEQVNAARDQATQGKAELAQSQIQQERELHRQYAEREDAFNQELRAERDELRYVLRDQAKREEASSEYIRQAQDRLESGLRALAQREQEIAAQLLAAHREAAQDKAELTRSQIEQERELHRQHAAREQAFSRRLEVGSQELLRLQQDRAQREQEHDEQSEQSRQNLEKLLRDQVRREQEVAAQLLGIQQVASAENAELVRRHTEQEFALRRKHSEREQTLVEELRAAQVATQQRESEWARLEKLLSKEIVDLQGETHALRSTLKLDEQRHRAELGAQLEGQNRMVEAYAIAEVRLKAEILAEQKTGVQLRQALAHVQDSLAATQSSLTWRITAPLRKLAVLRLPKKVGAPAVKDLVPTSEPTNVVEALAATHAILPSISEPPAINARNASTESIMLSSTQAIDPSFSGPASTLNELLAYHDQQFVLCAYQTILGRSADPEGLGYYLGRLRAGISKVGLLKQLRFSSEGRAHAVDLPGLDATILRQLRGDTPLIGWFFRLLGGVETNDPTQRKLRVIENQIFALNRESDSRFKQVDAALAGLHRLVAQSRQAIAVAPEATRSTGPATAETASVLAQEPEHLDQLTPRARAIYAQLKTAATFHAERCE
ncbi:FkbM family methyltransferase [Paraburkholderia dilworthii]|uniref:FkbM family methyltransferase n=1 Tax=Paraburkholderia dilworthii TaxID=948106 RepID=A0ABW9D9W9_9BURK